MEKFFDILNPKKHYLKSSKVNKIRGRKQKIKRFCKPAGRVGLVRINSLKPVSILTSAKKTALTLDNLMEIEHLASAKKIALCLKVPTTI